KAIASDEQHNKAPCFVQSLLMVVGLKGPVLVDAEGYQSSHNPRCRLRHDGPAEGCEQSGKNHPIRRSREQGNGHVFRKLGCDIHALTPLLEVTVDMMSLAAWAAPSGISPSFR